MRGYELTDDQIYYNEVFSIYFLLLCQCYLYDVKLAELHHHLEKYLQHEQPPADISDTVTTNALHIIFTLKTQYMVLQKTHISQPGA